MPCRRLARTSGMSRPFFVPLVVSIAVPPCQPTRNVCSSVSCLRLPPCLYSPLVTCMTSLSPSVQHSISRPWFAGGHSVRNARLDIIPCIFLFFHLICSTRSLLCCLHLTMFRNRGSYRHRMWLISMFVRGVSARSQVSRLCRHRGHLKRMESRWGGSSLGCVVRLVVGDGFS